MEDQITRWVRSARTNTSSRTDGITVTLSNGSWVMVSEGKTEKLKTPPLAAWLDKAIQEADEANPPAPWAFKRGVWSSGSWVIRPDNDGWGVFRALGEGVERASRQSFPSADRARRWAELRFDRSEGGLRGPKPRAGSRSAAKLPDVRVTEEERDAANATLEDLGMSYAVFVRASLEWARRNVLTEGAEWTVDAESEPAPAFVKRA